MSLALYEISVEQEVANQIVVEACTSNDDRSSADQEASNPAIVVEVSTACATGGTSGFEAAVIELVMTRFRMKYGDQHPMHDTLRRLCHNYIETGDKNIYYSCYRQNLLKTSEFGLPFGAILDILEDFYIIMTEFIDGNEDQIESCSLEEFTHISQEDKDILEYIGGSIIRRMFYHPQTLQLQREILMGFKSCLREGSIAYERDRGVPGTSNEKLWGISPGILDFLVDAEISFRNLAYQKLLNFSVPNN